MHPASDGFLVVTTRSRLRNRWTFLPMLVATRRIRRQLAETEGLVRWASIVAGPTEFWTVTVWSSRHLMQEFMRSEEHGRYLWQVSRWLSSFWLMRWRPASREAGDWGGLELGADQSAEDAVEADTAVADEVLREIPNLRAAMGRRGIATYRDAPHVARSRARVEGAAGLIVRIATTPWRRRRALRDLDALRRDLEASSEVLGAVTGPGRPDEAYLLAAFTDEVRAGEVMEGSAVEELRARWPGLWALECAPESEFGQWDGRRLRTELRRRPARSGATTRRSR